ncbi:HdeD family acid-resistance protein [Chitinophaga sp.]|uniref:HdeD family acid-resistance protein n=1 Tax=Chitinophaga sp. TaxID=1869181 RepID=UPI0031DD18DE
MIQEFAKYWWLFVLRGVLAILFAVLAFLWPAITLSILVIFLGAYFFVDGIFTLVHSFRVMKTEPRWWVLLLEGLVSIVAGLIALFSPGVTALFLVVLIAVWSLVTGILEIILAFRLRKEITNEWMLILAGVLSILFSILLFMQPITGVVVISWWIGFYALFFGIFLISVGIRLKKLAKHQHV